MSEGDGVRKKRRRGRGWLGRHRAQPTGSVEELAAQLAPLEEQSARRGGRAGADNDGGAIVVDAGAVKLPEGMVEEKKARLILGFEPVVLAIVVLAVAFIVFIAWQISQMPMPTD